MTPGDFGIGMMGLWMVFGYIIGSIPFGVVVARVMGLGNLRDIGSGNIGATNVLRTGNKLAAALTLVLDGGKGIVAILCAQSLSNGMSLDVSALVGLGAMVGHCYPVWLKFAGGKGVATFLGIMLALNFVAGLGCCIAWLIGAFATRISSMGALVASLSAILLMYLLAGGFVAAVTAIMAGLIFWRHRGNIARISAGTEPKIGTKK